MPVTVTMKELLEAGVHFGHQVRRWNPKMKEFIFGERNGINIIDLQKTQKMFRDAISFVTSLMGEDRGRTILFVGTKRQAQDAIREEAERSGQYYINQRWLGGLLTNFQTVQKSIKRLRDLEAMQTDGRYEKLTKKERIKLDREREILEKNLSGIKSMTRLPDALFVIDVRKEDIAVKEANRLGIPVIAVVDTNCSPEGIDYVIPGNDDALRAVRLFASRIADAVVEGQQLRGRGDGDDEATTPETRPSTSEGRGLEGTGSALPPGHAAQAGADWPASLPTWRVLTNAEVREWYLNRVALILGMNDDWVREGISLAEMARLAWRFRHLARLEARSMMASREEVRLLQERDQFLYGDPNGPTFEYLIAHLRGEGLEWDAAYRAVIEGSYRTNSGVNKKLGL